ncbi:MAG TPA: hypothetical protein VLE49_04895 [Anaerolineales bacterium]|nr:hypothetical protein [Anaerolineales bacterium]
MCCPEAVFSRQHFDPFSPLLAVAQDLLAPGRVRQPGLLFMPVLFSLLVFLVGWRIFHLTMPRVAGRVE